jgi:hypothetical protein
LPSGFAPLRAKRLILCENKITKVINSEQSGIVPLGYLNLDNAAPDARVIFNPHALLGCGGSVVAASHLTL